MGQDKWGNHRNGSLIRNLMGSKVDSSIVNTVEELYEKGPEWFNLVMPRLFNWAATTGNAHYVADVSVWVVRVLPDDANAWMEAVVNEYYRVSIHNSNQIYTMLLALFETAASLRTVPVQSSADGELFEKHLPEWLGSVLVKGKDIEMDSAHEKALLKAVKAFSKHHLICWRVCDAMPYIQDQQFRILWGKNTVGEFVIRSLAMELMAHIYEPNEIVCALGTYRENRRKSQGY